MANQIGKADANASRAFFVQMLTRDITLEDCILDLLDNSVDGAWTALGHQAPTLDEVIDLSPFKIEIVTQPDKFLIHDNCGGMPQERAEKHAFTFGRKFDDPELGGDFRIGVYGIGMKRAIFKLGSKIDIFSTYEKDGKRNSFKVPINVKTWMVNQDTDWSFGIYEDKPAKDVGVKIEVKDLTPGTKNAFGNPAFLENLRRVIARDYALHLHRGLAIKLNGELVDPWKITLLQGADFQPLRKAWTIATSEGEVNVEILAGAAALPLDENSPDESDIGEQRFGWYVACNGRIVLAADKTAVSVWGSDNFPIWHRQYRGFIGIILFTSEETSLLPLTTTKRSVDLSSEVYMAARPEMRDATRAWLDYTNARKQDRDRAKIAETSAKAISIFNVPVRNKIETPVMPTKPRIRMTSIQYSMSATKIREIAAKLGNINMPATQVGVATFEYAYEDMVGNG